MIFREIRVQGHSHQTRFAVEFNIGKKVKWFFAQFAVFDDAHSARTFGKKYSSVGRKGD